MNEVTSILEAIDRGDPQAASQLLPLVYDELRRLAAQKLTQEKPGQTLEATALVHEAYVRMLGGEGAESSRWANRRHFFAAAAESMRRILVDSARRKAAAKHGGHGQWVPFDENLVVNDETSSELLALHESLQELEQHDEATAQLVKLRYFAGLSHQQAAEMLGMTRRVADRRWALAKAWLCQRLGEE